MNNGRRVGLISPVIKLRVSPESPVSFWLVVCVFNVCDKSCISVNAVCWRPLEGVL